MIEQLGERVCGCWQNGVHETSSVGCVFLGVFHYSCWQRGCEERGSVRSAKDLEGGVDVVLCFGGVARDVALLSWHFESHCCEYFDRDTFGEMKVMTRSSFK